MGTKVHDKVFYIAEEIGVPKKWLPVMLDMSETTLMRWSYNRQNVPASTDEDILRKIAIIDKLFLSVSEKTFLEYQLNGAPKERTFYAVTIYGNRYFVEPSFHRTRQPANMPVSLRDIIRNAIFRECAWYRKYPYAQLRTGGPCYRIAMNTLLEMPRGVFRWDKG